MHTVSVPVYDSVNIVCNIYLSAYCIYGTLSVDVVHKNTPLLIINPLLARLIFRRITGTTIQ